MTMTAVDHAFPMLTAEEIRLLQPLSEVHEFNDGDIVFRAGDADPSLFVVEYGALDVLNPTDDDRLLVTHRPGQFSGDIDLLIRRPIIVTGIARGRTRVLRVCGTHLHEVLKKIPPLSDKLMLAFQLRRELLTETKTLGLKVLGHARCKDTTVLREFLHKNFVPFTWYDPDTAEGAKTFVALDSPRSLPVVLCSNGVLLVRPTLRELASGAGIWQKCPNETVDFAIVGAGPAGISAAVYAASEGLNTIVIDRLGPGGQAGGTSKIENFIGFPTGLSGADLAMRGVLQMLKFGAKLVAPVSVESIQPQCDKGYLTLTLSCGAAIRARTVLIACGVTWRKLAANNADRFERQGVYYACTGVEACLHDDDVAVVGGGNSAGQAAMYLAECCPARTVHIMSRGRFGSSMSEYLRKRIEATPSIRVHESTEISEIIGGYAIEAVETISQSGVRTRLPVSAIFVFIGAEPGATWLPSTVQRDEKGFILTGIDAANSGKWPLKDRDPCPLETTMPGLLAGGDIRSGTTKRVGFAVGDGSLAVTCVNKLLAQI
jgi:thioredoxin reductase (NADPH)